MPEELQPGQAVIYDPPASFPPSELKRANAYLKAGQMYTVCYEDDGLLFLTSLIGVGFLRELFRTVKKVDENGKVHKRG